MANLRRLRVTWSGFPVVGDCVSTFYSRSSTPTGFPGAVRSFFSSVAGLALPAVTITVPNSGDVISDVDGSLQGVWVDGTAPAAVVGTNTGDFAKGVGAQVRWHTDGVVGGRRVVGSTFIVPLAGGIFDTDGTLDATYVTALKTAGDALITSQTDLAIWSRPQPAREGAHGTLPARTGSSNFVLTCTAPDRVAWLRSRRQ